MSKMPSKDTLRTLKDLKRKSPNPMYNMGFLDCAIASKAEVIKWVKAFLKLGVLGDLNSSDKHNENMARKSQINWIRIFFNITEEDLA